MVFFVLFCLFFQTAAAQAMCRTLIIKTQGVFWVMDKVSGDAEADRKDRDVVY